MTIPTTTLKFAAITVHLPSIDHTETSKCQYTPTSPTGASIFNDNTINNRNQKPIALPTFIVQSI